MEPHNRKRLKNAVSVSTPDLRLGVRSGNPFRASAGTPPPFVKRQATGTEQSNCNEPEQHTEIRAALVHRRPESLLEQHWNFGCRNCDGNVYEQRHSSMGSKKTDDQKCSAYDFYNTYERTCELRNGDTYLREASSPQRGWKEKLLDTFREEDPTQQDANEQYARREAVLRMLRRHRHGEPHADLA